MKKVYKISILIFSLLLICGCSNNTKKMVMFKDDQGYEKRNYVTYKFYGESEHFVFETGKVYYGDNGEVYIYIDNFKVLKDIKNGKELDEYKIDLCFNNDSMFSNEMSKVKGRSFDQILKDFSLEESGIKSDKSEDAFTRTDKYSFKSAIKLSIKYCYKDGSCKTEILKLRYV